MLRDAIKTIEHRSKKLEEYEGIYKKTYEDFLNSVKVLDEKIMTIKSNMGSRKIEVGEQRIKLEQRIAEIVAFPSDQEKQEIRNLSDELNILKYQETALNENERNTIIINCKREIHRVKEFYRKVTVLQNVICQILRKYSDSIRTTSNILVQISKNTSEKYEPYSNMADRSVPRSGEMLKPYAEILFNTNTREPWDEKSDDKTVLEVLEAFQREVIGDIQQDVKKIVRSEVPE